MNWRKYGQTPYIVASPLAFIVFFAGTTLAVMTYPEWSPIRYNLSEMGTDSPLITAVIFNGTCVLAGILLSLFGAGKWMFETGLNKIAGLMFGLGGFGLAMIGIANEGYHVYHAIFTLFFTVVMVFAIAFATAGDLLDGDVLVLFSSAFVVAFLMIQLPFFRGGASELISVLSMAFWSLVQMIKYLKNGSMDRPVPAES